MQTVLPTEPEPCVAAEQTMKEIHLSSVTSIPASRVRVESMQTVQLQDSELFANVDQTMLVILSVNVVWNLVQPTHVESMLIVPPLEAMLCANVVPTTPETRTPIATLILAPAILVVKEHSVRTMGELPCVSVHQSTLAIPTSAVD